MEKGESKLMDEPKKDVNFPAPVATLLRLFSNFPAKKLVSRMETMTQPWRHPTLDEWITAVELTPRLVFSPAPECGVNLWLWSRKCLLQTCTLSINDTGQKPRIIVSKTFGDFCKQNFSAVALIEWLNLVCVYHINYAPISGSPEGRPLGHPWA